MPIAIQANRKYNELKLKGLPYLDILKKHFIISRSGLLIIEPSGSEEIIFLFLNKKFNINLTASFESLKDGIGTINTYLIEDEKEKWIYGMGYDTIGNINRQFTAIDFASNYDQQMFKAIFESLKDALFVIK